MYAVITFTNDNDDIKGTLGTNVYFILNYGMISFHKISLQNLSITLYLDETLPRMTCSSSMVCWGRGGGTTVGLMIGPCVLSLISSSGLSRQETGAEQDNKGVTP